MGSLSVIEIIYIIFLLGSLAFGLEAMFFGFGGKLLLYLRHRKGAMLLVAFGLGITIVVLSAGASIIFHLEPIYFVVLVLLFSFVVGGIIRAFSDKSAWRAPPPPLPESTDEEIKTLLSARGYGNLLESSGGKRKKTEDGENLR